MTATPCVACQGFRLKPEALAVKIDGKHIGEVEPAVGQGGGRMGARAARRARRQAQRDRRARPQGDHRPADLPERRRPRLSDPVARLGHLVGRREPAHPPRFADRLGPDRRALRARRAVDRPAPARQRPPARHAAAPARTRQHGDRRRARRGRDPRRRLRRRHRPRRRRPRRRDRRQGHAGGDHRRPQLADRPVSFRRAVRADAAAPPRRPARPRAENRRRARQQSQDRHRVDPARRLHLRHRRLRRRQVDADRRHALQGDGAAVERRQRAAGAATTASTGWKSSTRSSTSTSRRSAARRAPTRRPTPAPSRRSANGSPACRKPSSAATRPGASRSTSRAGAAKPARATA